MPPWSKTEKTERVCIVCSNNFYTKREAKYCGSRCKDRARVPREINKDQRSQYHKNYWAELSEDKKDHARSMARERSRKLKQWISDYKVEKGCVDCGYNEHPVALDFDHMDGKTSNIANLKSISAVLKEIEKHKCVVRCAICHRIKSYNTKSWIVDKDKKDNKV